ncbi:pentatricopeptide repeat-containing protein At3g02650, mitochondrial [Herrania umbratica]|uniref:Pentatricopeptide repeat-containing protein At3g02650, mitochondrial n=1 Tax=Herrania umbratica TaxID=108875 RepID=A0A6J0ZUV6_9ROSI|nr:pentatricopeptide repeat-containing protein At3g02650, mitochondrial [Herrania umbratica]
MSIASYFLIPILLGGRSKNWKNAPPGPVGWPILGSLPHLSHRLHEDFFHLAKIYGPLFCLKMGIKPAIVVSSPEMASEILKEKEGMFSSRTITEAIRVVSYDAHSVIFSPYGPRWKALRRILITELLSPKAFEQFEPWAWSVCEKMLDGESLLDGERVGKIISWFCRGGKAENAHTVYLFAKEKNKQLPRSSVNFLISSLCKKDETVNLALEMLDGFSGEARKYAIKPFSSVVRGLCRMKNLDEAKALLLKMIAEGPPPGNAVFNSVVGGYSKAGDMDKAKEMIKLMEDRGLKPDVYTYTVVMSGYANGGQMDEACEVLSEAKKKHMKLSPVTYHTLIRGYCKIEEFDKALKLLAEMKDFGVQPNVDEYNKLIQSLCLKALDWQTAEKLLDEMKENGLYLNGITQGLIKAVKELEAEEVDSREAATTEV